MEATIVVDPDRRVRQWDHGAEAVFGRLAVDAIGRPIEQMTGSGLQERLESLLAVGPAVLYSDLAEPGFPNTFTSANAVAVLGIAPEGLSGLQFMDRVHPDDRAGVAAALDTLLDQRRLLMTYRLRGDDGHYRWVRDESQVLHDASGAATEVVGYLADVTDQHLLAEERVRLAAAMDQTTDGIVMIDAVGVITYVNASFLRMTGRTAAELLGSPAVILAEGPIRRHYEDAVRTAMRGERWMGTVHAEWLPGEPFELDVAVWPLLSAGQVVNLVAVLRDVTREQRLDADLHRYRLQREALVESFARLPGGGSLDHQAGAIAAELAGFGGVEMAAIVGFTNGHGAHELAAAGPAAGHVGPLLARCGDLLRQLATRPRQIDAAEHGALHHEIDCPWEVAGLEFLDMRPLVADGSTFGVLLAGGMTSEGKARIAEYAGMIDEYAAVAAAMLAPAWAERRRSADTREEIEAVLGARAYALVFQPVHEIETRTVVGYEALTRFADGTPPETRFAAADRVHLGLDLEEATLAAALEASERLPGGPWLSLNVSPALILEHTRLRRLLEARGTRRVVLEVTEHAAIDDYARLRRAAKRLGEGIDLAVDDAGARFASLRHIAELRPRFVKLDMTLVRGVTRDPARQGLIAGMVHFAIETGCVLIAEGIERETELRALRRLGVVFGQGYLFSRPSPA